MAADIRVSIDRGGTFCDVIAHVDGREPLIFKLLSEDPANYPDAPTEGIRRVLEAVEGKPVPVGEKLDGSRIASCRIGTTVGTNALLEHKGERFAFLTTKGFKDVCVIGDQSRPKLFDLDIRKPGALHDAVVEVDERIVPADYDLNPTPLDEQAAVAAAEAAGDAGTLVRTASGEFVRILRRPDPDAVRAQLRELRDRGYTSLAICFMHSYLHPAHEDLVASLARDPALGFEFVTTSAAVSPTIKFLHRSTSACSEAYLYPVVRRYVDAFRAGFRVPPRRLDFMCSDGGLAAADRFRGNEALLSGPAGGVVGVAASCYDPDDGTPVIGFDMGGTSTDVSRYDGRYDYLTETSIHACDIADKPGIRRVLIHKYSSLLSAYGIAQAELQHEALEPYGRRLGADAAAAMAHIAARLAALKARVGAELRAQGAEEASVVFDESLVLRYFGTDTNLTIARPADGDYAAAFEATHLREFAFSMQRDIVVESIKVRGTGSAGARIREASALKELAAGAHVQAPAPGETQAVYIDGAWHDTGVYRLDGVPKGVVIPGPALLIDQTQTIFVSPTFRAYILSSHVLLDKISRPSPSPALTTATTTPTPGLPSSSPDPAVDPIQLSVFAHRFMAIAEQMGTTLQRTSISTSIKERLDFSCAIFSPSGKLVANAPHIPIHLGSMQFAIQAQHRLWEGKLQPGDVLLTNHPQWGGTHLPDLTVVTPVFVDSDPPSPTSGDEDDAPRRQEIAFYVASRGHHTDIGGKGITSMMPESRELWEEGLNVPSLKIVSAGVFLEDAVVAAFERAGAFPGCSTSRRLADNCARALVSAFLWYDFSGSGPQTWGNYNCPVAICHSAIIYTVRCLVGADMPLNEGCLSPVEIRVPAGSVLNPGPRAAICGSTLASQRVIDVILRAFGRYGASQGCANSFGWGMGGRDPHTGAVVKGWNYGESIGGGAGAGEGYHGAHSVHVHSTNTRQTDAEVIEKRTAVLVRRYEIRRGSGGAGTWRGGDGITREVQARIPLKFSILSDRRVYRPWGMAGGSPGQKGENYAFLFNEEGGMEKINLGGKAIINLKEGEYVQINTPGGGGYGGDEVEDRHRGYV
ncbi:hydantoinase B/oxoprolinase [Colletotrichum graminicola M1.001]|uniref:Hydantoinase B/oxoprolinase n=1 Tax=Colletotrichum graminicola (strain M1.001 / M2 / FGSC 10212) TaxID=645133 RepID=E3QWU0_COLGM|nr:hydantoinase B/oxoprolinase [Colletotrichum graminicola M1.001]EFQ35328.1 hydantoinase B/oxoprolinase [Colletotrichum graminicola M1.001]